MTQRELIFKPRPWARRGRMLAQARRCAANRRHASIFRAFFPFFSRKWTSRDRQGSGESGKERVRGGWREGERERGWEETRKRRLKGRTLGNREGRDDRNSGERWKGWKSSDIIEGKDEGNIGERREVGEDEDRWGRGDSSLAGGGGEGGKRTSISSTLRRYRLSLFQSRGILPPLAVRDIECSASNILARPCILLTKTFARFPFLHLHYRRRIAHLSLSIFQEDKNFLLYVIVN